MEQDNGHAIVEARERLAAFFDWWAEDQLRTANSKRDHEEHMEFYHRSQAFSDAAKAIREADDMRPLPSTTERNPHGRG